MTTSTLDLIDVRDTGDGPPVLFVHGVIVNSTLWDPVADLLPDHRRILPDLPMGSHRRPMPADADLTFPGLARLVARLMDDMDLEDVTVVANDTGCYLTQLLMTTQPERIGRVVLTSGEAFENNPPKMFAPLVAAAKVPGGVDVLRLLLKPKAVLRSPAAYGHLAKHGLTDALLEGWTQPLNDAEIRRDGKKVLASIDKAETLDAAAKLPGFDKPVLLAWSREDKFFPFDHAQRLAALLPDARVEAIDDSYTYSSLDQPQRLAGLIAAFAPARDRQPQAAGQPR